MKTCSLIARRINVGIEENYLTHYRKRLFCRVSQTLGKTLKTLGKGHTEEKTSAKGTLPSAFRRALGKDFAKRLGPHSAKFKRRDGGGT
jgi:hypothetical protein